VIAAARQRARRAVRRLSLTETQAETVRQLLRDDRRQWETAQLLLAECRRALAQALVGPAPDSAAVLELTVQERLLEDRERALSARVEERMAALLRPDQALRLRALAPDALGDVLGRLCA
jgi:Spy/CpxP family protein refolding chaperone